MLKIEKLDKTIFFNTGFQVLGKIITSGFGFLSSILLARFLGVNLFGEYNLVFIFLGLIGIFADFGLGTLLTREVAAKGAESLYLSAIFSLRIVFLIIMMIISALFLIFVPYSFLVKEGIVIALIGNIFLSLSSIYWAIFQAKLEFTKIVFTQVFSSLVFLVLVFLGTRNNYPLQYYIFANSLGGLFGFIFLLKLHPGISLNFDKKMFSKIIRDVWPIGLGVIVSTYYFKIDSLILSFFYNPSFKGDLGFYSAAYKFFEVATVFVGFFQTTSFPIISSMIGKKDFSKVVGRITVYGYLIAVVASVGLFFLAKPLLLIMGENYLPAVNSLKILSLALGLLIIGGTWLSIGVAGGRQKPLFLLSCLALGLNLILNLIFIPNKSFIGASWTTVITQGFIAFGNWLIASRMVK